MIQNGTRTYYFEHLGGPGPETIQNDTKTCNWEHLDSLGPVMVQSDIKTHHLKHLGSLGSEMLQNIKTNNLQPLNDTLRGLWYSRPL